MTARKLAQIMSAELPSISQQLRKPYRPTRQQVNQIYSLLNRQIFNSELTRPPIEISQERTSLGWCKGYYYAVSRHTYCKIKLANKYYSIQWLVMILAHEMSHQYQWDIIGRRRIQQGQSPRLNHGPSFFIHKDRLAAFGIPLRKTARLDRWFRYQDIRKL